MSGIDWLFVGGGVLMMAPLAWYFYGPKQSSAFALGDAGREVLGSEVITGGVRR